MQFAVLEYNKRTKKYDKVVHVSESQEGAETWARKFLSVGEKRKYKNPDKDYIIKILL